MTRPSEPAGTGRGKLRQPVIRIHAIHLGLLDLRLKERIAEPFERHACGWPNGYE